MSHTWCEDVARYENQITSQNCLESPPSGPSGSCAVGVPSSLSETHPVGSRLSPGASPVEGGTFPGGVGAFSPAWRLPGLLPMGTFFAGWEEDQVWADFRAATQKMDSTTEVSTADSSSGN